MNRMNGMQDEFAESLFEIDEHKIETDQLKREINELKENVADMKKTMGFDDDLFDDLDDFDKKVSDECIFGGGKEKVEHDKIFEFKTLA